MNMTNYREAVLAAAAAWDMAYGNLAVSEADAAKTRQNLSDAVKALRSTGDFIYELPQHQIGTHFTYKPGKESYDATVIGYHVEHDTDTGQTNVTYRISYNFGGQRIVTDVPRTTVERAILPVKLSVGA
jgi:hypothetical protein